MTNPIQKKSLQPVYIIPVKESATADLENMQLKIGDLIFRWVRSGAPIVPSMKDSIERVTGDEKLREYFWMNLRPKFLTLDQPHTQQNLDFFS